MNRVEEFKILRNHKRKCTLILLFFLVFIITGILISDLCLNRIIKNENKVGILKLENAEDTTIKMNVLNKVINLQYGGIFNNFDKLKSKLIGCGKTLHK